MYEQRYVPLAAGCTGLGGSASERLTSGVPPRPRSQSDIEGTQCKVTSRMAAPSGGPILQPVGYFLLSWSVFDIVDRSQRIVADDARRPEKHAPEAVF